MCEVGSIFIFRIKALYLRAKSLLAVEKPSGLAKEEALDTLEQVMRLAPENEPAKKLLDATRAEIEQT